MERFFKTLKTELVYQQHYQTREAAKRSIFEYVEVFHSRRRCLKMSYFVPWCLMPGRTPVVRYLAADRPPQSWTGGWRIE